MCASRVAVRYRTPRKRVASGRRSVALVEEVDATDLILFLEEAETARDLILFFEEAVTTRLIVSFKDTDPNLGVPSFLDARRDATTRCATLSSSTVLLLLFELGPFAPRRRSRTRSPMDVALLGGLGGSFMGPSFRTGTASFGLTGDGIFCCLLHRKVQWWSGDL